MSTDFCLLTRDHASDLLRLSLGVALDVDSVDSRDGHIDRKLDRVIGPRQRLLSLHLLRELCDSPLQLVWIAE